MNLADYRTVVFDCDGVILDSNRLKTEAFRAVAAPIDAELAEELVRYHVDNGGISRYRKFDFFIDRCRDKQIESPSNDQLCARFAARVREGLLRCAIAEGLPELRDATPGAKWLVASGADETELREVFAARGLAEWFDGGIFGSPRTKPEILARAFDRDRNPRPALMLGDSREDHRAARDAGLDFVFVAGWSEFGELETYAAEYGIPVTGTLSSLAVAQH